MGGQPSRAGSTKLTALQVAAKGTDERGNDLTGQVFIVTGANAGIGFETARAIASQNAKVILACRNTEAGEAAAKKLNEEFAPKASESEQNKDPKIGVKAECMKLDLADFDSIRAFAKAFKAKNLPLHCLVNNAGVMLSSKRVTKQGYEATWGVNHLGTFLLTNLLLNKLKESAPSRIVTVSSMAHRFGSWSPSKYPDQARNVTGWYGIPQGQMFYGDSKLFNLFMTKSLHRMLKDTGVTTYALHPGVISTKLFNDIFLSQVFTAMLRGPQKGAATSVYCATYPSLEEDAGNYFEACRIIEPGKHALNEKHQDELWKLSEELTGLRSDDKAVAEETSTEPVSAADTTSSVA